MIDHSPQDPQERHEVTPALSDKRTVSLGEAAIVESVNGLRLSPEAIERYEAAPIAPLRKAELLLVGLGEKPSALATFDSAEWREGETPQEIPEEAAQEYIKSVRGLGLHVETISKIVSVADRRVAVRFAFVANSSRDASELKLAYESGDSARLGKALGYPEHAIAAFQAGHTMSPHDAGETNPGVLSFAFYRISPDHAQEDLETARRWDNAVKRASPSIYLELVNHGPLRDKIRETQLKYTKGSTS